MPGQLAVLFTWLVLSAAAQGDNTLITNAVQPAARRHFRSLPSRFIPPYTVCTSDWAPMVMCAGMEGVKDFGGYQVALWRAIAKDLGWEETSWTFKCMDWSEMIDDLVSSNGSCSLAAAGVEISLPNIVLGLKFSWPVYKSGFQVLISSQVEAGGTWAFAEAFHWSVWMVLGATAIVVSLLVTVVEVMTYGNRANRKGFRGWSWYSMGKMVQVPTHVGDPRTWASRVLVLGYAFLALIMVHLFTATTASKLTMQRLANNIKGRADLPGKKVESWTPYVPLLRKYSIDAEGLPWDNDVDTAVMLDNLRIHKYQALILDSPVVQYFAAKAEQCDLYPVGDPFETFNLAVAFPPDAPDSLAANISASIVSLQTTQGLLDELENHFVKGESTATFPTSGSSPSGHSCSNAFDASSAESTDTQIHIQQVAGLWYILGITLGMAVLLTLIARVYYIIRRRTMRAERSVRMGRLVIHPGPTEARLERCQAGLEAGPDSPAGMHLKQAGGTTSCASPSNQPESNPGSNGECLAEVTLLPVSEPGSRSRNEKAKQSAPGAGAFGSPSTALKPTIEQQQPHQQDQLLRQTPQLPGTPESITPAAPEAVARAPVQETSHGMPASRTPSAILTSRRVDV